MAEEELESLKLLAMCFFFEAVLLGISAIALGAYAWWSEKR